MEDGYLDLSKIPNSPIIGKFFGPNQDFLCNDIWFWKQLTICFGKGTYILVGGLEHLDYFSIIYGNVIIPTDELHHFSEG